MTEQEKAVARAEKAESELAQLKAEQQRTADAQAVSQAAGVPLQLLEFLPDKEAMERFATIYAQTLPETHAAGRAASSNVTGDAKQTNAKAFEQFMRTNLNI